MFGLMRFLYEVLFFLFALGYFPFFVMKGKLKQGLGPRLGFVSKETADLLKDKKVIWVHAVSVGEMAAALKFAESLRTILKDRCFVFTATTAAGYEFALKKKSPDDVALVFPIDFRFALGRFIGSVHPEVVIILETEIWPNLIWEISKRGIPLFLMNARISDKAMPSYRRLRFWIRPLLNRFTHIAAQDARMRARFLELGAGEERVSVTGNMKFEWQSQGLPPETLQRLTQIFKPEGSVLGIAGSTHAGEEEALFRIFSRLRERFPSFRLLIAPRHLDRLDLIETAASKTGVKVARVSTFLKGGEGLEKDLRVFLLDEMGVLADWYALADLVFVGGSLVPRGGHNLVEPAFFNKPVVVGRFVDNFREMVESFKKENAVLQVGSEWELESVFISLISDEALRKIMGLRARTLLDNHQGAMKKNTALLLRTITP